MNHGEKQFKIQNEQINEEENEKIKLTRKILLSNERIPIIINTKI